MAQDGAVADRQFRPNPSIAGRTNNPRVLLSLHTDYRIDMVTHPRQAERVGPRLPERSWPSAALRRGWTESLSKRKCSLESSWVYTSLNLAATSSPRGVRSGALSQRLVTVWKSTNHKRPLPRPPASPDLRDCAPRPRVIVLPAIFLAREKAQHFREDHQHLQSIRT